MKYSGLTAFEKHLRGAAPSHFAALYTILAKDPFLRKQALECLTAIMLKDEKVTAFTLQTFDAEKHSIAVILQELESLSFFVKKRMVVIQNADAFDKAATTKLEAYFASPNSSVYLVIVASTLNRATTFYKKAEKVGIVLDIAEEKPWEKEKIVAEWLKTEAAKYKKEISSFTCQRLVKQLGTDQSMLQGELQKLLCYVGDKKEIDERDIAAISISINLENTWQLGEAIFRRDPSTALRIGKALVADGTALIALLRQIRSQFQTEYQVCSLLAHGGTAANIAQEFTYMKGSILDRHVQQAQGYGMERFKKGLLAIDSTELQAKNSMLDPDFLLERLLIILTTG